MPTMIRTPLLALALSAALLVPVATLTGGDRPPRGPVAAPLDSALEEIRVGRFWHAARVLRDMGAHTSDEAELRLVLARAEAGWKNWPEVARLLEGRPWLDAHADGEGLVLLGRAHEEGERWVEAQRAYQAYLGGRRAEGERRWVTLARLARVSLAGGAPETALAALDALPPEARALRSWAALEGAESRVEGGDTAGVRALLARVDEPGAREASWRFLPRARLAARDTAGALAAYLGARDGAPAVRRAEASTEAGRLALARRDSAAARRLLEVGFEAGSLRSRGRAAAALLSFQDTEPALTLRLAEVLDRAGDGGPALRAYDRAARQAGGPASLAEGARLARARLMATVTARHDEALEEFRAIRASTRDPRVGAQNLEAWAGLRRRQGRTADVTTLRGWLLEEYPGSSQAAEVLWDRGSSAESRGDVGEALDLYATLARNAPEHARAGEARMRTGQIQLGRGRIAEAGAVYEAYLADFPAGRRWDEASYWAARTHLQRGDTAAAKRLVARIRREEPVSYYAVMGADLVGEPYQVSVPPGAAPARPAWLAQGLERLDHLQAAGLAAGADGEERALVERARGNAAVLLTLAEDLIGRGRTVTGINLGWDLRREGAAWDQRLLKVVYPFPYREMVIREAREWGVDPIMLAAIIRQESAFKADIRSSAGAVGLMQVMPPTGKELARRHGPEGFAEANLEAPEVNLHLGAAFFRDMSRRYDDDLPLVLSAYNAGPTRATRWRQYPEASDPLRFTERIPFDETRGYVKNVRRNLGLYRALYGED